MWQNSAVAPSDLALVFMAVEKELVQLASGRKHVLVALVARVPSNLTCSFVFETEYITHDSSFHFLFHYPYILYIIPI